MIVRGYLCGSAWRAYKAGAREICGIPLPDGMRENEKFPTPIVTPTTKAEIGEHDADISKAEILERGLATPEEYEVLERYTLALFERGTKMAAERGLILVDTKYEFGKHDGKIYLMDEIHTPDSSRYFYADGYTERFEKGEPQKQLSKEFVREWLMANGFQGKEGQQVPEMTPEIVANISDRYIELYEHITGKPFDREEHTDLTQRIEQKRAQLSQPINKHRGVSAPCRDLSSHRLRRDPNHAKPARPQWELAGFYVEETAVKTAFFGKKRFRSTANRNGRYPALHNFFPLCQKRLGTWLRLNERRARACSFSDKPNENALKQADFAT